MTNLFKKTKPKTIRSIIDWHKTLGLSLSVFILFLAATGMLLHHANRLELERETVEIEWIQNVYGIEAPKTISHFANGNYQVSQIGPLLYANQKLISDQVQLKDLTGIVIVEDMLIVGLQNQVLLLDNELEIIEKLNSVHGLPNKISAIGIDGISVGNQLPNIYFQNAQNTLVTTAEFIDFIPIEVFDKKITWSEQSKPDTQRIAFLQAQFRSHALNWERVLLDIHSGRFFGFLGPWFLDFIALMLITLSITGIWIWGFKKR